MCQAVLGATGLVSPKVTAPERCADLHSDTRVQADSIVENYESGSPVEEIEENLDIPATIREVLAYAHKQQEQPVP